MTLINKKIYKLFQITCPIDLRDSTSCVSIDILSRSRIIDSCNTRQ